MRFRSQRIRIYEKGESEKPTREFGELLGFEIRLKARWFPFFSRHTFTGKMDQTEKGIVRKVRRGEFKLEKELGKGLEGTVYLVTTDTDHKAVMKKYKIHWISTYWRLLKHRLGKKAFSCLVKRQTQTGEMAHPVMDMLRLFLAPYGDASVKKAIRGARTARELETKGFESQSSYFAERGKAVLQYFELPTLEQMKAQEQRADIAEAVDSAFYSFANALSANGVLIRPIPNDVLVRHKWNGQHGFDFVLLDLVDPFRKK